MSTSTKKIFGLRQDFPFVRIFGFLLSIFTMGIMQPTIDKIVPSPYYSITNRQTGEDFIVFTELAIWILIMMLFVIFLTLIFIIPLALYFRGLSKWEWDPTTVVFWLIITWGLSLFFTEIAKTNSALEDFVLVLATIADGTFVVFLTFFVLRFYSIFIVPLLSDWINIGKSDTQYGPLLDILGSILIIIFGITNFLSTFNVEFGVLVAGVGVVGLVIALAAQDTLSNFFSGILLLLDQGFKTGDMIYFNDTYCLIREIGLRSTKIYDIINHVIIIIPNNSLANQNILNLTKPDRYYRLRIEVGVSYNSNPDEVEAALLEVAKNNTNIEQDDPTRKPLVRFQDFGDSTLNFALVGWIKNVIKIRQINSDLHHQVFEKLRQENIVIAFPQRDVHLYEKSKLGTKNFSKSEEDSNFGKKARQKAEEKARDAEEALKLAEESAKQAEEEKVKLEVEEAEKQVREATEEARAAAKKAEDEKSKKAEREARVAKAAAKKAEDEKAKLEAEEAARKAEEVQAKKEADKQAKKEAREAEQEAKKAEQEAKKAEQEARKVEEAKAKLESEEIAKKAEEEKTRLEAEQAAKIAEDKKAKLEAEEAAKIAEDKKAKLQAEEAETRKFIEEIKARQSKK